MTTSKSELIIQRRVSSHPRLSQTIGQSSSSAAASSSGATSSSAAIPVRRLVAPTHGGVKRPTNIQTFMNKHTKKCNPSTISKHKNYELILVNPEQMPNSNYSHL